jgi:hypothetical protein
MAEGRVHGPALTVGDKEYQVGERVTCLAKGAVVRSATALAEW